jgi:hypothetical protein
MHAVVRAFIYLAKQSLEQLQCRSALVLGEFGFLLKDLSENRNEFVELRQRLDPGLIFENWSRSTNHLRNRFLGNPNLANPPKRLAALMKSFNPIPGTSSANNLLGQKQRDRERSTVEGKKKGAAKPPSFMRTFAG